MIKKVKITIVLLLSLILTSCIEMKEIENLGIINARGVDVAENNLFNVTLVVFQFTVQSDEVAKVISGKGKSIDGAVGDAENTSIYKLAPGKIKVTLYGKETAEKGLLPLLDTDARDSRIPDLMYLAVSKTTAKEILSIEEQNINMDTGQYLHGLIENHARDHNIPRKTIQDFLRIYYDVGQDNVLPLFEVKENLPKQTGTALFKGDQMVGELTTEDATLINLMDRTVKEHLLELSLPLEPFKEYLEERERRDEKDVKTVFNIKKGKSKTTMNDPDGLSFQTDTTIELRLLEQSAGIILDDPHVIKLMEKEVEKKMEARFDKLLAKLKKLESDPFGYGRYYKSSRKGKNLTNDEWRKKYPEIDVKFNVDVSIIRHGVID